MDNFFLGLFVWFSTITYCICWSSEKGEDRKQEKWFFRRSEKNRG